MKPGISNPWALIVFPLYLGTIMLISFMSRRQSPTSNDYLNASRSLPTWAAALSFLAYNCGSIEIIGMSAMAAQYGVQALHFYWIGGIPGMIFMGIIVLPLYIKTGARSLPEYLGMRFGPDVRLLNACLSMVSTAGFSGVTLYAMTHVLHLIVGWSLPAGAIASALFVLIYVVLGGFRATVFTSAFQLVVMIVGVAPLLFLTVHFTAASFALRSDRWHLWRTLTPISPSATLDGVGVALGLGFVISFSYWCTDFVMIQRALTARTGDAARSVPLLAGFGKLGIALLVVLPGAAAPALLSGTGVSSFDEAMPALMALVYGPVLLSLGAAALLAGLMAGLAGNISGFSALWTEEIYRGRLNPGQTESHYVHVGRLSILACVLLALVGAYATFCFHDLMEFLQLILALFYPPVFVVVLAGITGKRLQSLGAMAAILGGVLSGLALQASFWAGWVHFGSQMNANFYTALLSFSFSLALCAVSVAFEHLDPGFANRTLELNSLACVLRPSPMLVVLSTILFSLCVLLNVLWW
jgi:SSS family solute:Na+ symporter